MSAAALARAAEEAAADLAPALVLAACGVATVPLAARVLRALPRPTPVFFARWGFSHVFLVAFVAYLLGVALAGLLDVEEFRGGLRLMMLVAAAGAAGAAVCAHRLHPEGIAALGWRRGGNLRALAAGGIAYALVVPSIYGLAGLGPTVARRAGFDSSPQEVLVQIQGLDGSALVEAVVLSIAVAPLLEETFFRGFLQPLLVQNLHETGGVALTSLLFAALHGAPSAFLPLFALSLLLGAVRLRTGRLGAAVFVHALHNGLTLLLVLAFSGWHEALG